MTTVPPVPDCSRRQSSIVAPTPDGGATRIDLILEGKSVSRLWIVPFTLRIGWACVRMDGIAGVGTDEEHRNQGYSRRVLEAALARMTEGDAALTMLYGIRDFYPKFGYATAGPDHYLVLKGIDERAPLPDGWSVRPFEARDFPAARAIYNRQADRGVGAAVREPGAWKRLTEPGEKPHDCRVVVDPAGTVRAYLWRAAEHWYIHSLRTWPLAADALVLAEVMADGPAAADAVLAACRAWAAEESEGLERPLERVVISQPPQGPVAAAAARQDSEFVIRTGRCGGSMARVLDAGRLLAAMEPELSRRASEAHLHPGERLEIETGAGGGAIEVTSSGIRITPSEAGEHAVRLPQYELARLALGAFPPEDVLDRLPVPSGHPARRVVTALFPQRHPHMYLPDRF